MNESDFINSLSVSFKPSNDKSGLFTPHHTKFDVEIAYGSKKVKATYQCNRRYGEPDAESFLRHLLQDIIASFSSQEDFIFEYLPESPSREDVKKLFASYKACKKNAEEFSKLCGLTGDDLEQFVYGCDNYLYEREEQ